MRRSLGFGLILAVAAAFQAAAASGWERLSELRPGDRVTVIQTDRREHRGEFVGVSPAGLSIRTGGSELTIARPEISLVQSSSKSKSLRNAAIGAGVGVAGGVTMDQTWGVRLHNEGGYNGSTKALVYAIPIAVGAVLGWFTGRNPTIYQAPRK